MRQPTRMWNSADRFLFKNTPHDLTSPDQDSVSKPPLWKTRSITVDIDYSFGKGTRSFLRQVVPDTVLDKPMRVFA